MILKKGYVNDGYELILNVAGSEKDDFTVKAGPGGALTLNVDKNNYFSEREYKFVADTALDVQKTKAKFENGLLVLTIPWRDKCNEVKIRVE
jgi:HSP20 family molecular chaperone IbpA